MSGKGMRSFLAAVLGLVLAESAAAATFDVGGTQLEIPPPKGCTRVTEKMGALHRLCQRMVDPMNDTLAYYIVESDVPIALAGKVPPLNRYFILKAPADPNLKRRVVTAKDFAEIKSALRRQNKEIFKTVESKLPEMMGKTSQSIRREFDVDIALRVSDMVPLDPHYETDNAMAYSLYARVQTSTEGVNANHVVAATTTFMDAAGKIVYLYCYAPQGDLEWTREASKAWAADITAGNAPPPAPSSGARGVPWESVIPKAITGVLLACLGGLILRAALKSRKKPA